MTVSISWLSGTMALHFQRDTAGSRTALLQVINHNPHHGIVAGRSLAQ